MESGRNHHLSSANPVTIWENFVVTGKARAHSRRFTRSKERSEYITLGQAILERAFQSEGFEFSEGIVADVLGNCAVETVCVPK